MNFFYQFFSFIVVITTVRCQNHGDICGPDKHCNTGVGLICDGDSVGKCICAKGRFEQNLTSALDYKMEWSQSHNRCLGSSGSLCVGTRRHPNPNGEKTVSCLDDLTCVQIPDLPNGVGICKTIPSTSSYGTPCNQNNYCDASYGLICGDDGKCECGGGVLDDQLSFKLTWDNERELCVGIIDTPCVGTLMNPIPIGGEKRVECERGSCIQIPGYPPGIGLCKATDESTTTPKDETTTQGAGAIFHLSIPSFLILTILSMCT